MSSRYLITLGLVVAVVLLIGVLVRLLPGGRRLPGVGGPIGMGDGALVGVGVVGLVFHCGAMFFRSRVAEIPGTAGAIRQIDAMGLGSQVWYVVAAGLVLIGLRRQVRRVGALGGGVSVTLLAVALMGVGVTMYDGGALDLHLTAIFASVTILASIVALSVASS